MFKKFVAINSKSLNLNKDEIMKAINQEETKKTAPIIQNRITHVLYCYYKTCNLDTSFLTEEFLDIIHSDCTNDDYIMQILEEFVDGNEFFLTSFELMMNSYLNLMTMDIDKLKNALSSKTKEENESLFALTAIYVSVLARAFGIHITEKLEHTFKLANVEVTEAAELFMGYIMVQFMFDIGVLEIESYELTSNT